jgi:hypothetical protein
LRRVFDYHSLQKRKVICSIFLVSSPVLDAGEAMMRGFRDDVVVGVAMLGIGTGLVRLSERLWISVGRFPRGYVTVAGVARCLERRGR